MAPPRIFTEAKREIYLEALREKPDHLRAAAFAGVHVHTARQVRLREPHFEAHVQRALAFGLMRRDEERWDRELDDWNARRMHDPYAMPSHWLHGRMLRTVGGRSERSQSAQGTSRPGRRGIGDGAQGPDPLS